MKRKWKTFQLELLSYIRQTVTVVQCTVVVKYYMEEGREIEGQARGAELEFTTDIRPFFVAFRKSHMN